MSEEFEKFIEKQLESLKTQIDILRSSISEYEESTIKLKKTISNDLIDALIKRFEKSEKKIDELSSKLDSLKFEFEDRLSREIRKLRHELSEAELTKAISRIFEEKEIKVDSKPLYELKI
jgi:phage shock protein A